MRTRVAPVLRATASASASAVTSRWSVAPKIASAAASRDKHPGTSLQPRRIPLLFSCPFSQQHRLRSKHQPPSSTLAPDSPDNAPPSSVAGLLDWHPVAAVSGVTVHGFVRSVRSMKKYSFVTLGDGSSLAPLQAVVPASLTKGVTNGAAVRLHGAWTPSPATGQSHELHVEVVEVLGQSDAKKKYQTPEFLRTLPHLRPRLPFNAALLRFRSEVVASLGRFFAARGYVQTHPPLITSSDCEGAGEAFLVGRESEPSESIPAGSASPDLFFRTPKYLTVSTQLHLEALAQAAGSVWTLSPTFRAEASDTPRHLSEFYMLETELAFADGLGEVMDLLEALLRAIATDNQNSRVFRELLSDRPSLEKDGGQRGHSHLEDPRVVELRWAGLMAPAPWPRITYAKTMELLKAAPAGTFAHAPTWEGGLQTEHEKYVARIVGGQDGAAPPTPVFVTHYPRESKAFYMLPSEGSGPGTGRDDTVECFDLLVPEFCEIAGGSLREHRLAQLVGAMEARGLSVGRPASVGDGPEGTPGDLGWYVDLRRWGCPPHGGFGLGFDRLLCYLSGVPTIRDMVAFPRWYGRCDC